MRILYLDCFSGISGDMTVGALLDVGGDFSYLEKELSKLHIEDEYELEVKTIIKNGITSKKFDVILNQHQHMNIEPNIEEHHEKSSLDYTTDHVHHVDQSDVHNHHHTHSHHTHRSYKDIVTLIESADFTEQVKNTAIKIFEKIGKAEGKIHGLPLDEVHFHEVGAIDSIIDIVGTAILIDQLQIDIIKSSAIPTGSGKIHIDHGVYPVPAPATLEILKGIPVEESDLEAELTTPTGAAIVAALVNEFGNFPSMKVEKIGYGAGTKTFPNYPNVLRVVIGEYSKQA